MEGPSYLGFPTLRLRFANIMQQGSPSQPQIVGYWLAIDNHILQNLKGMVEIILVGMAVPFLHDIQCRKFW